MNGPVNRLLRWLFFLLVVRPIVLLGLGLNVRRRELLPEGGPAVIVANHNSHLDAVVLMTLLGMRLLPKARPVAASDYFLKRRIRAWFSEQIIGVIPIHRKLAGAHDDPIQACVEALDRGEVLILFPEGSRGEPEQMQQLRTGIAHLAKRRPDVPIVPVYLHGLGKALPRGEALLVPLILMVSLANP